MASFTSVSMSTVSCSVFDGTKFDGGVGQRAGRLGVVTLATDQTIGAVWECSIYN